MVETLTKKRPRTRTTVERMFDGMERLGMEPHIEVADDGAQLLVIHSREQKHRRYAREILSRDDMKRTLVAWCRLRDHAEVDNG